MKISRRTFLAGCAAIGVCAQERARTIQTVLGPIPADKLGFTLAHEHVICDFVGAEQTGRHRWDVDVVVKRMLPVLLELKKRGVTAFVDCTPAYIGRDPRILKKLAEETGLHIVTNTGYYGGANDKYVPKHAYEETADQLAARWVAEWRDGIEGSGVRPGFMKIGVDEVKDEKLSEIDEKIVRASARASKETKLTVVCHTGGGPAGLKAAKTFIEEGASANRFVVAHADGHGIQMNQQVAELGAWVSFDGISRRPLEQHLKLVQGMIEKYSGRLMLSHDNGWYNVGQKDGGEVRDFNYLPDTFLPALRKSGVNEAGIHRLTVENPMNALAL